MLQKSVRTDQAFAHRTSGWLRCQVMGYAAPYRTRALVLGSRFSLFSSGVWWLMVQNTAVSVSDAFAQVHGSASLEDVIREDKIWNIS